MDQLRDHTDDRLINGCVYCGGPPETRDHVPSRVLLDSPYPENLPVVGCCLACNAGFSRDEEYFACLVESAVAGTTEPDELERVEVAQILRRSSSLRRRIQSAKTRRGGQVYFDVEHDRVKNVVLKLARGHAAFELSQICQQDPDGLFWSPLPLLNEAQLASFSGVHVVENFPEVGSRAMQRMGVAQIRVGDQEGGESEFGFLMNDWLDVQDNRYRYLAIHDSGAIRVRIVVREYLACEVVWMD